MPSSEPPFFPRRAPIMEPLEVRRHLIAGVITGVVFDDVNGNGVRDVNEPGLANQLVFIDANLDGQPQSTERSTLTGTDGAYIFRSVQAGTRRVRHAPDAGRRLTSPYAIFYDVPVTNDTTFENNNFGNSTMGVVKGRVFNDTNGDGIQQSGEIGIPGWTVFMDKDNDGIYDPGKEKVRVTNSRGDYRFADLPPGKYYLRIVQQAGWTLTNPPGAGFTLNITNGKSFSNRNFFEHDDDTRIG